ncbi:MAG: class I SAM-dependent methyltransferase family protein [Desulfurococcales archaeon]|nr:class I SAM-dependent methyltransferase family protein [Desulfurococcales archaeon]
MSRKQRLLAKIAEEILGSSWRNVIWPRMEIIGDIIVLRRNLVSTTHMGNDKLRHLGETLLERIVNVRSVWLAYTPVQEYGKTRGFLHLAGEERSETIYREHGCSFMLDIRKTYFSPRLNHEHGWFSAHVSEGESILNMFAGIGFFSIIPACKKRTYSLAIDLNPDAYRFLLRNIVINKVEKYVEAVHGDAGISVIALGLEDSFDHVILPFPEKALYYLPFAYRAVKDKGELHIFLHKEMSGPPSDTKAVIDEVLRRMKCLKPTRVEVIRTRLVRTVGPRLGQYIVSVKIEKRG